MSCCLAAQTVLLLVSVASTGVAASSVSRQEDGKDYYEVLGIEREGVTDQIVKDAFRKQALKHHPDKNKGDPDAASRFTLVSFLLPLPFLGGKSLFPPHNILTSSNVSCARTFCWGS